MFYLFITGCVTCCNCGPCRKANGLAPTHQVINLARASGFDNVHDYLVHGRTGETPAQLLERKRTFDWGRWLLCDFVPATPADSETDLRESEDDTSAACDDTDPFDDTPCLTCGGLDRPEDFVLCDGCDQGGHFDCVGKCFFISVFILILVWAIVVTSCFVYRCRGIGMSSAGTTCVSSWSDRRSSARVRHTRWRRLRGVGGTREWWWDGQKRPAPSTPGFV